MRRSPLGFLCSDFCSFPVSTTTVLESMSTISLHSLPSLPSAMEATNYYHGLPSSPRLIARSSPDIWVEPMGLWAHFTPKELSPLGTHRLNSPLWEGIIFTALDDYLQEKGIQSFTVVPLRIGFVGQPFPPAVIFIGVSPGTLTAELGREVAVHCQSILLNNGINDIHVEIRESERSLCAMLYPPTMRDPDSEHASDLTANLREPFSTCIGLPICNAETPHLEGTGGFFFIERTSTNPNPFQFLTAKHALFHPENAENELYTSNDGPPINVMLLGDKGFKDRLEDIDARIKTHNNVIDRCNTSLKQAKLLNLVDSDTNLKIKKQKKIVKVLESLLTEIKGKWDKKHDRVIGHVVLSPPITLGCGEEQFTEDWATVQVDLPKSPSSTSSAMRLTLVLSMSTGSQHGCPDPLNTQTTASSGALGLSRTRRCSVRMGALQATTRSQLSWS